MPIFSVSFWEIKNSRKSNFYCIESKIFLCLAFAALVRETADNLSNNTANYSVLFYSKHAVQRESQTAHAVQNPAVSQ